jgi:WD40 repeat protein
MDACTDLYQRGKGHKRRSLFVNSHHYSATASLMNAPTTMTRAYWGNGVGFMLTVGQGRSPLIEIDGGSDICTTTFSADGEYIIGGGGLEVGVWRVQDGKQVETIAAWDARCLAVSKDGSRIAAGTLCGFVFVWGANTFEKVKEDPDDILGVDFSPDSTRLVKASRRGTATVWDIAARKNVLTLHHAHSVSAAKYSPQGDRIATATARSVRVWDSNNGRPLVHIPVKVTPLFNTGLLWSNNHLFVVSFNKIKQLEASSGSTVSEWSVVDTNATSSIALPQHGEFITYSTNDTVTFWDTSTHARVGLIQHPQDIRSIAVSPDGRFLAIGGDSGKIVIKSISRITVSIVFLWIMAHLNHFLVPLVFPRRIQSHCLVYIPLSRNLRFRSTRLPSIYGSTANWRTQRRY